MNVLRYTLITDGSSDKALLPIIDWLLHVHLPRVAIQGEWADLRQLPRPPRTLADKIAAGVRWYPCEVLFVHRDAEKEDRTKRAQEIHAAYQEATAIAKVYDLYKYITLNFIKSEHLI